MLHLLFGTDEYRLKERSGEIIAAYEKKHEDLGAQKTVWDVSRDWDSRELNNFLRSPSLFNENKVFVINGAFSSKTPDLLPALKNGELSERKDILGIVVSSCGKDDCLKKDKDLWVFLGRKPNVVEEISPLQGQSLSKWAQSKINDCNLKISNPAIKKLIFYCGNDSQRISQELDKLICYKAGKTDAITEDDIEKTVARHENINSFSIADAISSRQKGKAVYLLHKYSTSGEDLNGLFGALVYQFRNLVMIRDLMDKKTTYSEAARKLNLHSFVFRKSYDMASHFNVQELKSIYGKLSEAEVSVKFGKYDIGDAVFDFIVTI